MSEMKWIPVKEQLPEVHFFKPNEDEGFGDFSGWFESDYVLIFAPECFNKGYGIAQLTIEDGEVSWLANEGSIAYKKVLAWMPLPKPYTEVKSNDNDQ